MSFKKLDSDAVSAADNKALDAFVLQQEAANYSAAHSARGRGIGHTYTEYRGPVVTDTRPVLASPAQWASCAPLGAFPVSDKCTQLTCQVRGIATAATGKTDAVELRLLLQKIDGTVLDTETSTTVTGSASAQTVTLTIDCTSVAGSVVIVWLYFVSIESAVITSGTHAGDDVTEAGALLRLNHLAFTYDAAKRYAVTFDEDAAGADPRDSQGYPGAVLINGLKSTHHYRCIPALPAYMQDHSLSFDVFMVELGRLEVYGWTVTESAFDALPDLHPLCRPGGRLRARTCQELYRRGYHQASSRTRLYSAGSSAAQLVRGISDVTNADPWSTRTIAGLIDDSDDIYVLLIGDLPQYQVQQDSSTPTTERRRRYRALVLYAMTCSGTDAGMNLTVRCEGAVNGFGGGPSWGADALLTAETSGHQQTSPANVYMRGETTSMSLIGAPNQELNYRYWMHADILAGMSGLRLLDFQWVEADAYKTDLARLLRFRFQVDVVSDNTVVRPPYTVAVFPGCTVLVDEGF